MNLKEIGCSHEAPSEVVSALAEARSLTDLVQAKPSVVLWLLQRGHMKKLDQLVLAQAVASRAEWLDSYDSIDALLNVSPDSFDAEVLLPLLTKFDDPVTAYWLIVQWAGADYLPRAAMLNKIPEAVFDKLLQLLITKPNRLIAYHLDWLTAEQLARLKGAAMQDPSFAFSLIMSQSFATVDEDLFNLALTDRVYALQILARDSWMREESLSAEHRSQAVNRLRSEKEWLDSVVRNEGECWDREEVYQAHLVLMDEM